MKISEIKMNSFLKTLVIVWHTFDKNGVAKRQGRVMKTQWLPGSS